ncbi:MAG TPA: hypothetical protein VG942_18445 [Hyphomonadaceae bacterium]|nr:hypothetical protein [Hyphomonadaceae bacterium]
MKRTLVILAAFAAASCGTIPSDRAISGALIGGGVGVITGGVGLAVGAILGGSAGYVMTPEQINLGAPIWRK